MLAARVIADIENPADVVIVAQTPVRCAHCTWLCQFIASLCLVQSDVLISSSRSTLSLARSERSSQSLVVSRFNSNRDSNLSILTSNFASRAFTTTLILSPRVVSVLCPRLCSPLQTASSIATILWMLVREVNRIRGLVTRAEPWNVMVMSIVVVFRSLLLFTSRSEMSRSCELVNSSVPLCFAG